MGGAGQTRVTRHPSRVMKKGTGYQEGVGRDWQKSREAAKEDSRRREAPGPAGGALSQAPKRAEEWTMWTAWTKWTGDPKAAVRGVHFVQCVHPGVASEEAAQNAGLAGASDLAVVIKSARAAL